MAEETTNKEDSLNIPFPQYTKNFKKKKKKNAKSLSTFYIHGFNHKGEVI